MSDKEKIELAFESFQRLIPKNQIKKYLKKIGAIQ